MLNSIRKKNCRTISEKYYWKHLRNNGRNFKKTTPNNIGKIKTNFGKLTLRIYSSISVKHIISEKFYINYGKTSKKI